MRLILIFVVLFSVSSCRLRHKEQKKHTTDSFNSVLEKHDLKGTILLYDVDKKTFYSNDFAQAEKGFLPASTFKIANTIIALETKVMDNDSSLLLWDGKKRDFKEWEKNLTLREAFQASCVPCFQYIAQKIGVERMNASLEKINYPPMVVNDSTLTDFWLRGPSRITAFQQIAFLEKLKTKKLPIADKTYEEILRIMVIEQTTSHALYGKTGWSYQESNNNGWFVGFIDKHNKTYYFALNVEPKDASELTKFIPGRKQAILEVLTIMNIL